MPDTIDDQSRKRKPTYLAYGPQCVMRKPRAEQDCLHGLCPRGRPIEKPRFSPIGDRRILRRQPFSTVCFRALAGGHGQR
jgi:hypothetical protein